MTLYDPLDITVTSWFPANGDTGRLVAALLACRDIVRLVSGLGEDALSDHHGLVLLAVPTMSLAEHTVGLHASTGRHDTSHWPTGDRQNLREWGRALRRLANGPLRRLRNTLGAHHDPEAFGARAVEVRNVAPEVLTAIRLALGVLVLLLNHEGVFVWSRQPTPNRDVVQFHGSNPHVAPSFRVEGGRVVELVGLTISLDPRAEAQKTVEDTLDAYNLVAARSRLPQVRLFSPAQGAVHA